MDRRIIGCIIAYMFGLTPAYATNVCDPVAVIDCASVNSSATGGGVHTSEYGSAPRIQGYFAGQKSTYIAALDALTNTSASGVYFSICGSYTKTVRVVSFNSAGSVATTAARLSIVLTKTSTPTTGGTALAPAPKRVKLDTSNAGGDPSVSLLNYYTTGATAGTVVGTIATQTSDFPITATIAATDSLERLLYTPMLGGGREFDSVVLRNPNECLEATLVGAATVPTLIFSVTWTEEIEIPYYRR